jgi:hypothetical protein
LLLSNITFHTLLLDVMNKNTILSTYYEN